NVHAAACDGRETKRYCGRLFEGRLAAGRPPEVTAKRQPAFHGPHGPPGAHVAAFHDFSITLRRVDAHNVAVKVHDSPAGALRKPVKVAFSASEASEMRAGFLASFAVERPQTGGMMLTVGAATAIGQRLAQVLFPPAV